MEIVIKESTIVGPAEETPRGSVWCSHLDLLVIRHHIPTVYFYKKPNGCSNFFDPERLKEALSKILVPFYPIAGRLGYDENGRLELVCNGQGVLFIVAETTSYMDHFVGNFADNSPVLQLVPKVDYSRGVSSYPLVTLQVTTFKCGGVCLGVGFQHTLGDGMSALHFINNWADIARGLSPTIAPFIDRTLLRARDPPTPVFDHVEYDPPPLMKNARRRETISISKSESDYDLNDPSTLGMFKLTADQLNILKSKQNLEDANRSRKYTSYNVLAAHIWRCVSKARGLSDDQATKLHIPVDGRSRLNPPLPPGYFGNVIFQATTIALAGDLQSEPFTDTLNRIYELLNQINDEYLRSALDYIEKVDDISSLVRGLQTFRCPHLIVNNWTRLPLYDADFGWGRPIYMGPATVVLEGIIYILPSPTNDGSLSLLARLDNSAKKLFKKFLYEF